MFDLLLFSKLFCNDKNFIIRIEYDMKHQKVLQELCLRFNTFSKLFCNDKNFIIRIEYDMKHQKVLQELCLRFNTFSKNIKDVIKHITKLNYVFQIDSFIEQIEDIRNKKYNDESRSQIIKLLKQLLSEIQSVFSSENKIAFVILIFELLDTEIGNILLQVHKKFRAIVEDKIKEFQKIDYINKNFSAYMRQNYETGKKYIRVSKNKK